MNLHQLDARIRKMKNDIDGLRVRATEDVGEIFISRKDENSFVPFRNGNFWGTEPGENWYDFRFTCTVPEGFYGQAVLCVSTGLEGWEATMPQFVVWVNGRIEQSFDTRHKGIILQEKAIPGTEFDILLQAYHCTNSDSAGAVAPRLRVFWADTMDDVTQLYYDIDVPHEAALLLPDGTREKELTLQVLSDALNLVDMRNPYSEEFHRSVTEARAFLDVNYYKPLEKKEPEAVADCVGHTHIDVAWLWDLYQTRHKAVRTFATMLKLMEKYPEFKFMSSQAQLYEFVKEDEPELFERIRKAIADGRWEAEGGMWVEADCNLSGGEALVRQLLYGNEFFVDEFGKRSKILWLPDVFGYSAALPQILKKSGIDYFMTSKLSWSEFNCTPYDTFIWKGIDGSEVLTHFTPARDCAGPGSYERHDDLAFFTTYNAILGPSQIKGGWERFQQKGVDNHFIISYGYGDGGGGSCDWMIENARRMKNPVAGCPAVRQTFALDFFRGLEQRVKDNKRLPKWSGELYLEYHRGTYTSQARNKRNNRLTEIALRDLEYLCVRACDEAGFVYPQDELREIWRKMLTLQFHDILPGSSIHKVYTDSDEIYAEISGRINKLREEALNALGSVPGDIAFTNTLSSPRDDIVTFDGPEGISAVVSVDGVRFPVQVINGRYTCFIKGLKPMSTEPFTFEYGDSDSVSVRADEKGFETPFFRGMFDEKMRISSLVDKDEDRELVKPGQALNSLVCYENRPHNYDAWDINIYYPEHSWDTEKPLSAEVISEGPVCTVIRVVWPVNKSTVMQDMYFYKDVKRIDFRTVIDWKEPHLLLKAHFPVDVFYNAAQFDIQYGNVTRATHKNTSWDVARFEVCAHKWAEVSEASYGAAILNDCKYGYSVDENSMALTLVKGATYPDPAADQCMHEFSYSFMPHSGDWRDANVPKAAYEFNIPVTSEKGNGAPGFAGMPFATVDAPNVIIESVKKALHGEGTIVRMYECFGARTKCRLTLGRAPSSACFTSLMEDDLANVKFDGKSTEIELNPYEIVTLRIK